MANLVRGLGALPAVRVTPPSTAAASTPSGANRKLWPVRNRGYFIAFTCSHSASSSLLPVIGGEIAEGSLQHTSTKTSPYCPAFSYAYLSPPAGSRSRKWMGDSR